MMDRAEFLNRLRSLHNIDGFLLPELSREQQSDFLRDPVRYFMGADKAQSDAIWREVEKRQAPKQAFAGDEGETLARAKRFVQAAAPHWCSTCGVDTIDTDTCAKCAKFWAEAEDAADAVLGEVSAFAAAKTAGGK